MNYEAKLVSNVTSCRQMPTIQTKRTNIRLRTQLWALAYWKSLELGSHGLIGKSCTFEEVYSLPVVSLAAINVTSVQSTLYPGMFVCMRTGHPLRMLVYVTWCDIPDNQLTYLGRGYVTHLLDHELY